MLHRPERIRHLQDRVKEYSKVGFPAFCGCFEITHIIWHIISPWTEKNQTFRPSTLKPLTFDNSIQPLRHFDVLNATLCARDARLKLKMDQLLLTPLAERRPDIRQSSLALLRVPLRFTIHNSPSHTSQLV